MEKKKDWLDKVFEDAYKEAKEKFDEHMDKIIIDIFIKSIKER